MLVSWPEVGAVHHAVDVAAEGPVVRLAAVERRHVQRLRPDTPLVQREGHRVPAEGHRHRPRLAVQRLPAARLRGDYHPVHQQLPCGGRPAKRHVVPGIIRDCPGCGRHRSGSESARDRSVSADAKPSASSASEPRMTAARAARLKTNETSDCPLRVDTGWQRP